MDGSGLDERRDDRDVARASYRWSVADDRLDWSDGAAAALGVSAEGLPDSGAGLARIGGRGAPRDRDAFIALARIGAMSREVTKVFEYPVFTGPSAEAGPSGPRWFEERIVFRPAQPEAHLEARCEGMLRDVTQRSRDGGPARDALTGALTREALRRHLADALTEAVMMGRDAAFLVVGLDHLGALNGAYGYDVADDVIADVATRLSDALEPGDRIGRISGGKFGIVVPNSDRDGAVLRMQELRAVARGRLVETPAGPVAATVSVGCAFGPAQLCSTQDVMAAAQDALSEARRAGPDSQGFFIDAPERREARGRDIAAAAELSAALDQDRIVIAFQPIVDAKDPARIVFHECLARIRTLNGEVIAAGAFMEVAEKLGLVRLLDRRMLSLALDALRKHPTMRLSVNLSPATTQCGEWLAIFEEACAERPDLGERLIFEVTETTAIADAAKAASFINHVRSYGAAVAIDDFGAGYTSFRHLKDLHLDMVKIDGQFVRDICENPDNQLFVKTLISIARHFDMTCVAEFVDSPEVAAYLRDEGVDCLQGYYFGAPSTRTPVRSRNSSNRPTPQASSTSGDAKPLKKSTRSRAPQKAGAKR